MVKAKGSKARKKRMSIMITGEMVAGPSTSRTDAGLRAAAEDLRKMDTTDHVGMRDIFIHLHGNSHEAPRPGLQHAHFHPSTAGASVRATSIVATAFEATDAIRSHRTCMDTIVVVPEYDCHWAICMKA